MWTIFKVLNCYNIASILCFGFLAMRSHEVCGILAPQPGIKPTPLTTEGEVLTTGPPGKSQKYKFFHD